MSKSIKNKEKLPDSDLMQVDQMVQFIEEGKRVLDIGLRIENTCNIGGRIFRYI
jgi:hypothetical protein